MFTDGRPAPVLARDLAAVAFQSSAVPAQPIVSHSRRRSLEYRDDHRRPLNSGWGNDRQRIAGVSAPNGFYPLSRSGHGQPLGDYDDLESETWPDCIFRNGICWGHFCGSPGCMRTANFVLGFTPAPGVAQPAINWWYVGGLVNLWLTPIALAAAYYLIPKIIGRPIYSYKLALLAFWGLALFGGWTGLTHIIGGPLPAWMVTASIVAKMLMLIPVLATAVNFHSDDERRVRNGCARTSALRFVITGAVIYTAYSFGREHHFRSVDRSIYPIHLHHGGPQSARPVWLLQHDLIWSPLLYRAPTAPEAMVVPKLIETHFWLVIVGLGLLLVSFTIGGLIQGFGLEDPQIPMIAVNDLLEPFLAIQNFGALLLVVANLGFAIAFVLILLISTPARQRQVVVEQSNEASESTEAEVSVA